MTIGVVAHIPGSLPDKGSSLLTLICKAVEGPGYGSHGYAAGIRDILHGDPSGRHGVILLSHRFPV